MHARAFWSLVLVSLVAAVAPPVWGSVNLGEPTLNPNEDIRHETGIVNGLLVDRYTWRDSTGHPRSASLVRYGQATGGYAVQLTYQIPDAQTNQWQTVYLNPPPFRGDAGFGYFVSHELYRYFDANVCPDGSNNCTIAAVHGEDDSPLGSTLPGKGRTVSVTNHEAIHEFTLNYPHWGTTVPIDNPNGGDLTPSDPASHKKYNLPVTIRWTFTAGHDYPLWSVTYDVSAAPINTVDVDMRGPYGYLIFDEADAQITSLEWGDQYIFKTQGQTVTTQSSWTWNTLNTGARYNLLVAGQYEMGLVQAVPYAASTLGSGYSDDRGQTSAHGPGCSDTGWLLPCDWEWTYQSIQYENFDASPTLAKKIAWGTAPYIGSDKTGDDLGEPFTGYPVVMYSVWITFDKSGGTKTRTLAASTRFEGSCPGVTPSVNPNQTLIYNPSQKRADKKTIKLTIANQSDAPQTVTRIDVGVGEPFTTTSISPRLPRVIKNGKMQKFTVKTQRAAGLGSAPANPPFFTISMSCGFLAQSVLAQPVPWTLETDKTDTQFTRLQLFDLSGRKLIDRTGASNALFSIDAVDSGHPLANGVYLYVVSVRDRDGRLIRNEIGKWVLQR